MVIKNKTVLSGEEVVEELVHYGRRYYARKYIFPGLLAILGCVSLGIVMAQGNPTNALVVSLLFICFAVILALYNTITIITLDKKTRKKNPVIVEHGMINYFTFREESFSLQVTIGTQTSKLEYPYNSLKKIIEHDEKIFFVISDTSFYSCKKECFSSEKEEEVFFYGLEKHKIKVKRKTTSKKEGTQ